MDKPYSALIVAAVLVLALSLMALGWRSLKRRQSGLPPLTPPPGDFGPVSFSTDGLYVATTRANEAFQRIAVRGLGFRSRSTVSVAPQGVAFTVRGGDDILIPAVDIESAGRATWTIDKAVESGGLAVVTWRHGGIHLDSYFRIDEPETLLAEVSRLIESRTGSDAQ